MDERTEALEVLRKLEEAETPEESEEMVNARRRLSSTTLDAFDQYNNSNAPLGSFYW